MERANLLLNAFQLNYKNHLVIFVVVEVCLVVVVEGEVTVGEFQKNFFLAVVVLHLLVVWVVVVMVVVVVVVLVMFVLVWAVEGFLKTSFVVVFVFVVAVASLYRLG